MTPTSAPVCAATTITVEASADTWLNQAGSRTNYGGDQLLRVQARGTKDNTRALIRFNQPAAVPAGCAVESATMRLFASSSTAGRTLQAYRVTASWSETAATWANQPATASTFATAASGSGYREWDVTAQVREMYAGGANHGFLIRDASESGSGFEQQLNSRERGTNLPQLVIRFAPATATPGAASLTAGVWGEVELDGGPTSSTSVILRLSGMEGSGALDSIRLAPSDLQGGGSTIPAERVAVRLEGSAPTAGSGELRAAFSVPSGAVGRYTGTVTVSWRDRDSGAAVAQTIPVELTFGQHRVYLPLTRQ